LPLSNRFRLNGNIADTYRRFGNMDPSFGNDATEFGINWWRGPGRLPKPADPANLRPRCVVGALPSPH
jgi:hypothetical protein